MRKQALLALLVLILAGCKSGEDKPKPKAESPTAAAAKEEHHDEASNVLTIKPEMLRDLKVTIAETESRPAGEGSMLLGELKVNENAYAEIGAPVSSRVISINVEVGRQVGAGSTLAVLQSTELGKTRADVITARSKVELAQSVLERKKRLASERIVAQREVQESEAALAQATAELNAARATVRALGAGDDQTDSSQYALRSPVAGTVIERNAVRGKMVDSEEVLFRVGDLSRLWLTVHAFERDAVRIKTGSAVRITFPAIPGTGFSGKVDLVGKQVNSESRTVPVRIVVENRTGLLRPGMSATAFVSANADMPVTIMVPAAAVQRLGEDWVVFIPRDHEGEFEIRVVGRGRDLGGEIEIVSGLKKDEKIVVDGAFLLKAEAEKARGGGEEHEH